MKTWQLWVAASCIFLAGAISGVVGTGACVRHIIQGGLRDEPGPVMKLIERRLGSRLELNPEQQAAAHRILLQGRRKLVELRKRYQPEVRAIILETKDELSTELTERQQRELDDMFARFGAHLPLLQKNRDNGGTP